MDYVYTYLGPLPKHIFDSFLSVKTSDPKSKIFLITDNDQKINEIEVVNYKEVLSIQTKNAMHKRLKTQKESSFFRMFLVRDAINSLNLKTCYHFDPDVLLFQNPLSFEKYLEPFDGMYITPVSKEEVVFGFSRMGSFFKINEICSIFYEDFLTGPMGRKYNFSNCPTLHGLEMKVLGEIQKNRPDLIKLLPILPNKSGFVFDPSSYGIYIGSSYNKNLKRQPGWIWPGHLIGEKIMSEEIDTEIINNKPYVINKNTKYPLINLHLHSKNTDIFMKGV